MHSATITITCPNCSARNTLRDTAPTGEPPQSWLDAVATAAEVECPVCGWEFAADEEGRVTDDGGLDPDGPFAVGPEGELVGETLLLATCPNCTRRFEVGEVGVTQCPGCRRRFAVDDPPVVGPPAGEEPLDWDEDELPYDECFCPACGSDGDLDSPGFLPLGGGWVLCQDCGWEFREEELFRDLSAWHHEERAHRRKAGRRRVVVAAGGGGDFKHLDRAVEDAADGGEVVVRPGVYPGPVRLALRRLTVRGEGPADEVRLTGGLEVVGGRVRIQGLTVKGPVRCHRGRLGLVACRLREAAPAGLEVTGVRGEVRTRDCAIEQCRGPAVLAASGTVVRLTGSTLSGNAGGAVRLEEGAWLQLRDCRVTGNGGDGVSAAPHSSVFLHRCLLADNDGAGVALASGQAMIRDCRVLGQRGPGVVLGPRGRLLMCRNEVCQGQGDGLAVGRRVLALVAACQVTGNSRRGVVVGPGARVVLARCALSGNGAAGVHLAASARLGLRRCLCRANAGGDWDIEPGGCLRVPT